MLTVLAKNLVPLLTIFFYILLQLRITSYQKVRLYNRMIAVLVIRCQSSQAAPPPFCQIMRMIRQKRGSNNKRQERIESKGPVTVVRVVTVMLIITTRVKAYNLLSSAGCLLSAILL
jgi:hypothetical protein